MSFLSTVSSINLNALRYTPTVIAAVQTVEAIAPPGSTGAQKFAAGMAGVAQVAGAIPNTDVQAVGSLLNLAVFMANFFGVFLHATVPPAPPA